jgi:pilus assembly protein FimV
VGQQALKGVIASALCLAMSSSWAMGLGKLSVQSALGEPLRAEIDITSMANEESSSLKVRVAPAESYRAAGVEYNAVLPSTQVTLLRRANGQPYLKVVSNKTVQEPFVDVILEISWPTGRLVREYTMLFDPSNSSQASKAAEPEPMAAPVMTAAAVEKPSRRRPVQAEEPAAAVEPPEPKAQKVVKAPKPAAQRTREAPVNASEYRVRAGDSLSRIAARMQRSGVSLDQMLVSLYRSNPQAFIGENMNRLKAGVVLAVPVAGDAKSVTNAEARQIIHAQSSNFGSYRRRLADAVPAASVQAGRQAGGKVEAKVDDRNKSAVDAAPDKLTLSKSSASAAKGVEDQASKEKASKDASTRVAELSKSVDELKKLNEVASAAKQTVPAVVVAPVVKSAPPAAASEPASAMSVVPTVPPVVATPPVVTPAASAPELVASAPTPAVVASEPEAAASQQPEPAPEPALAAASSPEWAPAAAAAASPGFLEANPWVLPVGGGLLALLGGFGAYRLTRRARKDSGETSFLESRLQPDSFFGASGGQRIDTRDASGQSSSMSYSLSQLDAIGDVDPVAEADVYLAYGRDLQAEEILKEAMRSTPDRMAIRTKLLEVYAKRRDVKGFELLATQLFSLTHGQGEDWAKTQEMGAQIDADNAMYKPGGKPAVAVADRRSNQDREPLGASTMPLSILPTTAKADDFSPSMAFGSDSLLDLDLDLDNAPEPAVTSSARKSDLSFELDIPDTTPSAGPGPAVVSTAAAADLDLELDAAIDVTSPLARKLELAEEFRQIGDSAGARDLLQEVVTKSTGRLKEKAQGLLDKLR